MIDNEITPEERRAKIAMRMLEDHLCFLSEKAVAILIDEIDKAHLEWGKWHNIKWLLHADPDELIASIHWPHEECCAAAFVNVFLWKQLQGKFNPKLRIWVETAEPEWDAYSNPYWIRHMIEIGYENVWNMPAMRWDDNRMSFMQAIETIFPEHFEILKEENEIADSLIRFLAAVGPVLKNHPLLPKIISLLDYIVSEHKMIPGVGWTDPDAFLLVMNDLSYDPDKTWKLFRFIMEENLSIRGYILHDSLTTLLAIRFYGDKARKELKSDEIPDHFHLIDRIAEI